MDSARLEIEYSPSSMVGGDAQPFIRRYIAASKAARESLRVSRDVRYGDHPGQVLDLYHASPQGGPLHIFIHGGYWQELSYLESATMAEALVKRNVNLAVVNYTLAPAARIAGMVKECYQAITYLVNNGSRLQIDARQISISGHSAGAQLMMQVLCEYAGDSVIEEVRLAAAISGIYDLIPLCHTTVNNKLGLDEAEARSLSPMWQQQAVAQQVVIAVAENDTAEFRRQASQYYQKLVNDQTPCRLIDIGGRNHFDIVIDLDGAASVIIDEIENAHR